MEKRKRIPRETYRARVYRVLAEQHFVLEPADEKIVRKRLANKRRYFFLVAKRIENGRLVQRFIKIPGNDSRKLLEPFARQIEFSSFLQENRIIRTRKIIAFNYKPLLGTPFFVQETFPPKHARIGFIEDDKGTERLTAQNARSAIEQLEKIHRIRIAGMPKQIRSRLRLYPGTYASFSREILRIFRKRVRPRDLKGAKRESFAKTLERRAGLPDAMEWARSLLHSFAAIVNSKENRTRSFVHGDMAPNNLYIFDSGDVELLDFEWVGTFNNVALAMVLDFGNLRARAWRNPIFQKALDDELLRTYRKRGVEKLGETIVALSILRSHALLASFFENYPIKKQRNTLQALRRKATEKDLLELFRNTSVTHR